MSITSHNFVGFITCVFISFDNLILFLKSAFHFLLQSFLLHICLHIHMPYKNRGSRCSLGTYKRCLMAGSEMQISKDLVIQFCYFFLKFKFSISEWLNSKENFASHWQIFLKYSFLNSLLESIFGDIFSDPGNWERQVKVLNSIMGFEWYSRSHYSVSFAFLDPLSFFSSLFCFFFFLFPSFKDETLAS